MEKMAFIICVNDEEEFNEAEYYIDDLIVPDGFIIEKIIIRNAPSMTAGYNKGMNSSDARYKVYMHQDVFILSRDFISVVTGAFEADPSLGILGVIGATNYPPSGNFVTAWNFGALTSMMSIPRFDEPNAGEAVRYATALDGLILITQYDVPFRDDLFTGWDFYDVSICFEHKRMGYNVGIICRSYGDPVCHHDAEACKIMDYYYFRDVMAAEYADIFPFEPGANLEAENEHIAHKKALEDFYEMLLRMEKNSNLETIMDLILDNRKIIFGHRELASLKKIMLIAQSEKENMEKIMFWQDGETINDLLARLKKLRFAILRIKFKNDVSLMRNVLNNDEYSYPAIAFASVFYIQDMNNYILTLAELFIERGQRQEFMELQNLIQKDIEWIFAQDERGIY